MAQTPPRQGRLLPEACGVAGLIGLFCYFLAVSWRKWPDPVIDFGRELYLPWRLSHGAVLYRDLDAFYGPLSQYFDSALFTIFGPSLMLLATTNILIFASILTLTYWLFRRAWGPLAALTSVAVFIAVFGFSQYTDHGNFNYVTPYSQETTHGIVVCLALVLALTRWVESGTLAGSFLIGLLFGCTLVLKPEFMLAGALLILGAVAVKHWVGLRPDLGSLGLMACGAILPTLSFTLYFALFMPWGQALATASLGWLDAITTTRFSGYNLPMKFAGLDTPGLHFYNETIATFDACYFIAIIAASGWLAEQRVRRWLVLLSMGLPSAALLWAAIHEIEWTEVGRCLPGLMLMYTVLCVVSLFGAKTGHGDHRAQVTRLLLALLATTLLARMFLFARVYHYGYYQAALAAIMVPAILIGELPQQMKLGRRGAFTIAMGTLLLLLPGVMSLCALSNKFLSFKTVPVGSGGDRFYSARYDPTGEMVDEVSQVLRMGPRDQTLVVLPEGPMINYLARLPSSVASYCYFGPNTMNGREALVVDDLERHPPDRVVIISRGLLEYGVQRYGAEPGEGQEIIAWVAKNYTVEEAKGGDPLDHDSRGVIVLSRKAGLP